MRSALVFQCSPCRCAISAAPSQIVSGRRVRGGFALRHSVNRWLSCNKSSGIAVFSQDMPHGTTHRSIESRTLAGSSLSNVKLRVFPSFEKHNLRRLLASGLCVTINSDDPAYFGGYISENFLAV